MNIKKYIKDYNNEIYAKTKKYQKIYGFEIGTGSHDAWNNEADAFKHSFMQADLALKYTIGLSKLAGDYHEFQGELNHQPEGEKNMDLWNNKIGREIAKEIKKKYNPVGVIQLINSGQMDDIIAEKIMQRMRKGELITNPTDKRKYRTPTQKFDDEIRTKIRILQEENNRKLQRIFQGVKPKKEKSSDGLGHWVTINGRPVYIDCNDPFCPNWFV